MQIEFAGKKVVLFSVPGAFTPGCSAKHLPSYIQNLDVLKAKGVDIVAVIAFNDAFVMSAWGKANGIKDEIVSYIHFPVFLFCFFIFLLLRLVFGFGFCLLGMFFVRGRDR